MEHLCDKYPNLVVAQPDGPSTVEKDYLEATKSATFHTHLEGDSRYGAAHDDPDPRVAFGEATVEIEYGTLLDLLKHHLDLEQSLKSVATASHRASADLSRGEQSIKDIEKVASVYRKFLVDAIGWNPLDTAPSATSASAAEKVFKVPELLEMILCELSPKAMLAAFRVNRAFAAATSSAKLQMQLGLRPNRELFWETTFGNCDGRLDFWPLEVSTWGVQKRRVTEQEAALNHLSDTHDLWVSATFITDTEMSIGCRCRSMLVCQPPIQEMVTFPSCCTTAPRRWYDDDLEYEAEGATVRNKHGITVGDLYDATVRTRREHCLCPHAPIQEHDQYDGYVKVGVQFGGFMRLKKEAVSGRPEPKWSDDRPSAFARRRSPPRPSFSRCGYDEGSMSPPPVFIGPPSPSAMENYVAAKRDAYLRGSRILTYAEFLVNNGYDDVRSELGMNRLSADDIRSYRLRDVPASSQPEFGDSLKLTDDFYDDAGGDSSGSTMAGVAQSSQVDADRTIKLYERFCCFP